MENKSPHILNASSNLLGFCLVILTSLRITRIEHSKFIDEFTGLASLLFVTCCLLSFLALRTKHRKLAYRYERIADYFFVAALLCISIAVVIVSLNYL